MPSQFSSEGSVEDAKQLAENLGIEFHVVPITDGLPQYRRYVDPGDRRYGFRCDGGEYPVPHPHALMLMALQNKNGYVLLNCSNKSENALGICTLYAIPAALSA